MSAEQLSLKLNNWETRKSLAEYTDEERRKNDQLILQAHIERKKLSAELQHYQLLKTLDLGRGN